MIRRPGRSAFDGEEAQEAERRRLHAVIAELVLWENSNNENVLNRARWEIARSVAWGRGEEPPARDDGAAILDYLQTKAPPVHDPFCGGGSIPLEAQRLGLRAYGSDLNPVAVLISKALVEIPPKFAGRPPVHPRSEGRGGARMHYRETIVWTKAMAIAREVYRLAPLLPREETYGMRSQITRAATSIPANVAEGWTRESSAEKRQFLAIARDRSRRRKHC